MELANQAISNEAVRKLATEMVLILSQLLAAFGQLGTGDVNRADATLTEFIRTSNSEHYVNEALYLRTRIRSIKNEVEQDKAQLRQIGEDYSNLIKHLPDGMAKNRARMELAMLAESGKYLSPTARLRASRRNLKIIGRALHSYAADNRGALPKTLADLMDEYITDVSVLIQPGPKDAGYSVPYEYTPNLIAEILTNRDAMGKPANGIGGIPIIVFEKTPSNADKRLLLRIDGEIIEENIKASTPVDKEE